MKKRKKDLDLNFVRRQFPVFSNTETRQWAFFENAGGSYVPRDVIYKLNDFMIKTKVQPYGDFDSSIKAGKAMDFGVSQIAKLINAKPNEIIIGPSTTMNMYVLSNAIRHWFKRGDEIIVTNQDHEANVGAWRRYAEYGINVKEWKLNSKTGELEIHKLKKLITKKTKLVCVTHCSNIVGTINNIKEINKIIHKAGAYSVFDGVSFMPHSIIDVKNLDIDFYAFSLYKTYGPHLGLLYGKRNLLKMAKNQNHSFLKNDIPYTLNPGGVNHEETAALSGITDYYERIFNYHFGNDKINLHQKAKKVFKLFYHQEEKLSKHVLSCLLAKKDIKVIGRHDHDRSLRTPTISFVSRNHKSLEIVKLLLKYKIAVRNGDFYAWRCLKALGINTKDGVVRISIVHYNTENEVERLTNALNEII